MATKKKMLQAAAGNAGGEALNVEDVFSTYLYDGTGASLTIDNGIDLDGKGGLVWIKGRIAAQDHHLFDTERGVLKAVKSNKTNAESSHADSLTAFNSSGFTLGSYNEVNTDYESGGVGYNYASWTFRKAPKFFDVVTYTGDGVAGREIAHNLGTTVGSIIVKRTDANTSWPVYHRGNTNAPETDYLFLNSTNGTADSAFYWNDTEPTDSVFTVGAGNFVNASGGTYVAYLFAHNDGDGDFGPDGDADIIKCGSYTGNGSTNGPEIDLGFEPQWLLTKAASSTSDWHIWDAMRGVPTGGDDARLTPNTSEAEFQNYDAMSFLPTGFKLTVSSSRTNASGVNYIYMAIRRGTKVPESGTEAFDIQSLNNAGPYSVGFPTDLLLLNITGGSSSNTYVGSRLTGGDKYLRTSSTAAEGTSSGIWSFDLQDSFAQSASPSSPWLGYHWKRAPGFFDVVAYTGDGASTQDIKHNLGVAPEFIFLKSRNSSSTQWPSWHSGTPNHSRYLNLTSGGFQTAGGLPAYVGQNVTDTTFRVSTDGSAGQSNGSSNTYIAYLFASLPGISKAGSASHSGTTNVDCGFTSGARFVLLKRTDASGDWYVWDSVRGIVSGNDPYLLLNSTAAQVTTTDYIDPLASGFTITSNFTAGDYIFYAIA